VISFRRAVGLDFMDVVIQTGVTLALIGTVVAGDGPIEAVGLIIATSFVILGVRRHGALKRGGEPAGLSTGQMAVERFEEMDQRLAELEASQARVAELEDRLDFAERLLAQAEERSMLGRGEHHG
jgi:hypothetical protein